MGYKTNAVPLGRLFCQFLDQPQMSHRLDRKKNRQHLAGLQNRGGCPSGWAARVLDTRSLLECGERGCPKGKVAMESKRLKFQRENCHFIDSGMIAIVVILKGICDTEINFDRLSEKSHSIHCYTR